MKLHNNEAEKSVIGSIFIENSKLDICQGLNLDYADFYFSKNRVIYQCILDFAKNEKDIDLVTISDELSKQGIIPFADCVKYILDAVNNTPVADHIGHYAKIVKDYSTKRNIKSALMKKVAAISTVTVEEMLTFCDDLKCDLLNTGELEQLFLDASEINFSNEKLPAIRTGFTQLDSACGEGLVYGSLTVLTGSPGSGKSTLINQIMAQAISDGTKCFLYSGELTYQMQMGWFAKTAANFEDLVATSNYLGKFYNVKASAQEKISNWVNNSLFIYSKDAAADEKNLSSTIEYLAAKKGVRLFVLDNLMTLEFVGSDKYEKQIAAVKSIKALAKKYDLAIILIAHPNKSALLNKDPHVFEISGASEVPNMADYVIKIVRDENDQTEIILMKNRITGIQGKRFRFNFSPMRKRFYSSSKEELHRDYGYNKPPTHQEPPPQSQQNPLS